MTDFWPGVLSRLVTGDSLSADHAREAMHRIMAGDATAAQIAAFAVSLRIKGETPEEITGLASAMLELAPAVETPGPVVDTCGTGGDRAGTINVSTTAAIVAAGAGAVVAKHGNRAASSRSGSETARPAWDAQPRRSAGASAAHSLQAAGQPCQSAFQRLLISSGPWPASRALP